LIDLSRGRKSRVQLLFYGFPMSVYRAWHWLACALVLTATSEPALSMGSRVLVTSLHAHSYVIVIKGRKGTRNYVPGDSAEATDAESGTSTEKPKTREERIEQCMASWDSKTHITKANWRKICDRQLSDE
jgi:hypothetical protein